MDEVDGRAVSMAALAICENLLAVLLDRDLLTLDDVEELLSDAAASQTVDEISEVNEQAAQIIRGVLDGLVAEGPE